MRRAVMLLALAVAGCGPSAGYEEWFAVELGASVDTPAGNLHLAEVIEDSRCRPEADCTGDQRVSVLVRVGTGRGSHETVLNGLVTPIGTMYGSPPIVELSDGSWLTITELSFADPVVATFYLTPPPRM